MQVILRDDMDNLGKSGEVVNVKPGYARNYLLPRGLAIKATATDVARVEHEKRVIAARTAKLAKETQAEADKLSAVAVSIARAVGEEDKLYGSVTSRDIAEALREKGVTVDAKKIHLDEPIKALGMVEVQVKLGRGVNATIKVWVVKQEKEES
jgi:large subunit ribosomal protein L9